jgi:molecular chaperone DnaK
MKQKTETLKQAFYKASEELYKNAGPAGGPQGSPNGGPEGSSGGAQGGPGAGPSEDSAKGGTADDVDYRVVDDEDKK